MLNTQKQEAFVNMKDRDWFDVINIWKTIQGEGPLAGVPAIFVRLAGCNLQCPMCDTNYTEGRTIMKIEEIVEAVDEIDSKIKLIVITGGEPFRQPISELLSALSGQFYQRTVQVETNGTLYRPIYNQQAMVVCSPKTKKIHPAMAQQIHAWKYVVEHGKVSEFDGLPESVLGMDMHVARPPKDTDKRNIYVQPMDSQDHSLNLLHLDTAVQSCMKHGYRLCLQTQKIVGLD